MRFLASSSLLPNKSGTGTSGTYMNDLNKITPPITAITKALIIAAMVIFLLLLLFSSFSSSISPLKKLLNALLEFSSIKSIFITFSSTSLRAGISIVGESIISISSFTGSILPFNAFSFFSSSSMFWNLKL